MMQLIGRHWMHPFLVGFAVALMTSFGAVNAGDLAVRVSDDKGEAISNAVVTLTPAFNLSRPFQSMEMAEMRQENTLFAPFVLPVRVGTSVSFPNFDESRHHVYSFSQAKRFELRLYGKDETNSIQFEKSGVVALGCNIHDNMLAYVYVTDAPIYLKSDQAGQAIFQDLEDGMYEINVWHPGVRKNGAPEPAKVQIDDTAAALTLTLRLRRVWAEQKEPAEGQY